MKHLLEKTISIYLVLFLIMMSFSMILTKNACAIEKQKTITKSEMKNIAANIFSDKCGIPRSVVLKSKIDITKEDDSFVVLIKSFAKPYENHDGWHLITLSKSGELLRWEAHGMYFYEIDPDVMAMGEEVIPLKSDAQESDVLALLQSDLKEKPEKASADRYTYKTKFMKNQCFGRIFSITSDLVWYIPVWIIYVYNQQDVLCWKAVYSNTGKRISLVPGEQDFDCYKITGENFLHEVFQDGYDIQRKMNEILRDISLHQQNVSEEQIDTWMMDWTPKYRVWLREHPYSYEPHMEALLEYYPQYAE